MPMEISRSEQKRRMRQLEQLVDALVALPSQVQAQLPCSEEIISQMQAANTMKGGARKRQIKYLTKQLKGLDTLADLYSLVSQHQGKALAAQKERHLLEQYRNALIDEALEASRQEHGDADWSEQWESETLRKLVVQMPQMDEAALRRLAYLFAQTHNPRHSREIFRVLQAAHTLSKRLQRQSDSDQD